ncbi:ABC transporter substrate-binding protein [Actinotalea ferrariae]|uniref:ABC transporter substrate-binding protein n=1 Tax=Actinotalea ferrariae TaxID=1386098 RepID=UPI001C8B893C|nr:ABC transporter substrate-binding protein [Actinotalea ferrariae]MBX9243794.1 ABC transporter substrate-binding protein [Actinotalea ferrariae]
MRTTRHAHRRRLAAGALTATAALVLAACGGGMTPEEAAGGGDAAEAPEFTGEYTGPDVELSYWNGFTGGDGPFMQEMVDAFMEEHDNITIVPNTIQWADFYQRVPAAVNANEGPDVGVMHADQLATNAVRNVIVPLDNVAEALELSEDDFSEEVWSAGLYEDQRYGIPLDVHSLAMFYNTEHFAAAGITEPPTDQESFMAALDALQAAGYPQPFWMPARWPGHLMFLTLLWQNGGQPYSDDGTEATFASPEGIEALEWMRSMVDEGYSPSDVAQDSQYVAFKNGETSITWDGIWQINDLEASGLPYALAPVPTIFDEQAFWANSHQFFMTKQATGDENKAAAAQVFIAWMSEHSAEWAGAAMIPARTSVQEEGALEGTPQEPIAGLLDSVRFLPAVPGLGQVTTETIERAVADAVLGQQEPAAALEGTQGQATELMAENAESFGG